MRVAVREAMRPAVLGQIYLVLLPLAWPPLPANVHWADLVFLLLAVQLAWRHWQPWRWTPLDACVLLYLAALTPSLLASDDLRASGAEFVKRAYLAALYVAFAVYFRAEGHVRAFRAIALGSTLLCGLGLAATLVYVLTGRWVDEIGFPGELPYIGRVLRLQVLTESPSMLGNYLAFAIPIVIAARAAGVLGRKRWLATAALSGVAMMLSFSHAIGGFAVAAVIAAWPLLSGRRMAWLRFAAATGAVLLVVVLNLMLIATVRGFAWRADFDPSVPPSELPYAFQRTGGAERLSLEVSYNPMSYVLLKEAAWRAFIAEPWTGVGLGRFQTVTEAAVRDGTLHEPYRDSDPHSTVFGALAETGLVGLAAIVSLFWVALHRTRPADTSPDAWFVFAAAAGLTGLIANSPNVDVMNFRFLWVGLAALRS